MKYTDFNNEFLTIKQFSERSGISAASLRHYDKIGAFTPAGHGKDIANPYRLYAPTQITTVKMIRVLTEIGVPLDVITKLTRSRSPEKMIKLLTGNRDKVSDEIRFLQDVHSVINTFLGLLNEGISATETEITVCEMPEKRIILGDINDFNDSDSFFREYTRFCIAQHQPKVNLYYPIGGYFGSMAAFTDLPSLPTRFFSLDPNGMEKRSAGLYLNAYTRGYYGETNGLPERMTEYASKSGLVFTGPVYLTYLFDEISMTDPEQYLLQASASVAETRRLSSRRPYRQRRG